MKRILILTIFLILFSSYNAYAYTDIEPESELGEEVTALSE